jgi:hypothetical protein
MIPDTRMFARWATAALGHPVDFAWATEPLAEAALSPAEQAAHAAFLDEPRRQEWRRGRAAVRKLAPAAQRPSVSHGKGVSVALAALDEVSVGVDLEGPRAPAAAAARFFLCDEERTAVAIGDMQEATLLRLFSTKEALLKAADGRDLDLRDFVLDDPRAPIGTARHRSGARFRYGAFSTGQLVLSVAASLAPAQAKEIEA